MKVLTFHHSQFQCKAHHFITMKNAMFHLYSSFLQTIYKSIPPISKMFVLSKIYRTVFFLEQMSTPWNHFNQNSKCGFIELHGMLCGNLKFFFFTVYHMQQRSVFN